MIKIPVVKKMPGGYEVTLEIIVPVNEHAHERLLAGSEGALAILRSRIRTAADTAVQSLQPGKVKFVTCITSDNPL